MLHFPFVTKITTFNITKNTLLSISNPHHKFLATVIVIVNSSFLERPQKRSRVNQFIHRRLTGTEFTHKLFCLLVIWIKMPLRHWDWVSQAVLAFKLWNNNQ